MGNVTGPGAALSTARKRLSVRASMALWDEESVAGALGADAMVQAMPRGNARFDVYETSHAPQTRDDPFITFVTRGFGRRTELVFRISTGGADKVTVDRVRRIAIALHDIVASAGVAFGAYDAVQCNLFPWAESVVAAQHGDQGLLLVPDPLLETLAGTRTRFLCCFALQPEEWHLQNSVPAIPLHAFIASPDAGAGNGLLVNSRRRESLLRLPGVEQLAQYARSKVRAAQELRDLDFSPKFSARKGALELQMDRRQIGSALALLQNHLYGDAIGKRTMTLVSRDGEHRVQFRNARGAECAVSQSADGAFLVAGSDAFFGNLLAQAWDSLQSWRAQDDLAAAAVVRATRAARKNTLLGKKSSAAALSTASTAVEPESRSFAQTDEEEDDEDDDFPREVNRRADPRIDFAEFFDAGGSLSILAIE